jgi:hypothetical protein
MNRIYPHLSRTWFLNLYLVLAVAAELLSAVTAHARMIDASAMSRDERVWAAARAAALPIEDLSSRGAFMAAIRPYGLVLESGGTVRVPYGYYSYSPLSYDPLSLDPNDPATGGVRCNAYFDNVWMNADAGPDTFEAGLQSDSNEAPPLPAPGPPAKKSSPGALASGMGGPGVDDAGGPANAAMYDEPAAPVFCPSARQRKAPGLVLANWTPRRDAPGLCRREVDGAGETSTRLCEWRCETRADDRLLAGFCPLSWPGNEPEFAFFDFHPRRAEATTHRRAPRGKSRAAALDGTPRPCGRRCDPQVDAAPSVGFCPRWPQANAQERFQAEWNPVRVKTRRAGLANMRKSSQREPRSESIGSEMAFEWIPVRFDARAAGGRTWIAFGGNSETAEPGETPGLCVRPREATVAPSAGFCAGSPRDSWPELARAILDRRARALTCVLQEDGEGAEAAARETPRLCEWRREPRAPAAGVAEFCPNPRRTAAVQRDPLDFSSVPASGTAANLCRRVACAILVFDADGLRPASLPSPGDGSGFPTPAPGGADPGVAWPTFAAGNANGPDVWPSVVTETQKRYCPLGTTPLTYAQLYFLFGPSSPVPEPSTWALMLAAFLGLGGVGWRRRGRGGEIG